MRERGVGYFHRKEPFAHHLPKAIHHARPIEVNPRRGLVLQRVKARAAPKGSLRRVEHVTAQGLE
ncbi:MAG: hypothetical protein ACREU7_08000, partial [Burkholderiales bacterium]